MLGQPSETGPGSAGTFGKGKTVDVWPTVAPYYDKASQGSAVFGWVVYAYETAGGVPPELGLGFGIATGRLTSFVNFESGEEGASSLTLGLRGALDMPASSGPQWFHHMELEIKLLPSTGTTVTTIGGAPGRRAGGDVTYEEGMVLASGTYIQFPMPNGGYVSVNLRDHPG
jgi:hypothetical protein